MTTTIRSNTFETNSSSVHALVIGNSGHPLYGGNDILTYFGEFGWENTEEIPLDYLLTAAKQLGTLDEWISRIEKVCGITITLGLSDDDFSYVDHVEDLDEFLAMLATDDDKLYRFIMDVDSVVYTGSDNSDYSIPNILQSRPRYDSDPFVANNGAEVYSKWS